MLTSSLETEEEEQSVLPKENWMEMPRPPCRADAWIRASVEARAQKSARVINEETETNDPESEMSER